MTYYSLISRTWWDVIKRVFASYSQDLNLDLPWDTFLNKVQITGYFHRFFKEMSVSRIPFDRFWPNFLKYMRQRLSPRGLNHKNILCQNRSFLPVFMKLSVSRAEIIHMPWKLAMKIGQNHFINHLKIPKYLCFLWH